MGKRSRADIRRSIHGRIRKKISGSAERPRLAVYRSTNHIYAQVIDDVSGKTLVSASSVEKDLRTSSGGNIKAAEAVGKAVAERAISAGISYVVFDRGGFIYHGRVKALLDATRSAGLNKEGAENGAKPKPAKEEAAPVEAAKPEAKAKPAKKTESKKESASDKAAEKKEPKAKKKSPEKKETKAEVETAEDSNE